MRIALVRPFNKYSYTVVPSLGLGYLSAVLKAAGHEVFYFDAIREKISSAEPFKSFLAETQPDVMGLQVFTADGRVVSAYLRAAKETLPRVITLAGGPHPSAIPAQTLEAFSPNLDFVLAGEAESGICALLDELSGRGRGLASVPGLAWRGEGGKVQCNAKKVVEDLDALPWPDWELLDPRRYPHAPLGGFSKGFPVAPVIVSRGCPMRCTFCAAKTIYGGGFRCRDVADVVEEIRFLKDAFGVQEIFVQDDNLAFKKSLLLEFCERMAPLRMHWNCVNGLRLDCLDEECARAMKSSGCYALSVGIESGSQRVLDDMRKGLKLETVGRRIEVLSRQGIRVAGQFIIGFPTETREDVLMTIELAKRLPLDRAAFASFVPLPGSQVYDDLERQGLFEGLDWNELSYYGVTRSFAKAIPTEELGRLLKKAIRSVHLRPRIIFRALQDIGSFANFMQLVRRFLSNYV